MNISSTYITAIPALKDNYIWMMTNVTAHTTLIVDPGDAMPVMHFLEQHHLNPLAILITHHHWDHTNGIKELTAKYTIPVYGPENNVLDVTHRLKEPDVIQVDSTCIPLQILNIPGHTLDHIAYYAQDVLFCGDTLFAAGCGRVFEGSPEQLFSSLQKIAAFPGETKIYCAHEYTLNNLRFAQTVEPNNGCISERLKQVQYLRDQSLPTLPSTLLAEKTTNPFLRCHMGEVKSQVEHYAGHSLATALDVFTELRKWKDQF